MKRFAQFALVAGVCALCTMAVVTSAAQQAEADKQKEADIRKLMAITQSMFKPGDTMSEMLPFFRQQMDKMDKETSLSAEDRAKIRQRSERMITLMSAAIGEQEKEIVEIMVPLYMRHFSHEEIRAALDYYESPAGQAMLTRFPVMMREMMPAVMEISQKTMKKVMEQMRKEFPDMPIPPGESPRP